MAPSADKAAAATGAKKPFYQNPLLWVFIALLVIAVIVIALWQTGKIFNSSKKWPNNENDAPVSFKLKGTDYCLQPKGANKTKPEDGTNLILNEGCDKNEYRYKVLANGQIQHFKYDLEGKPMGGSCLHPKIGGASQAAKANEEIIFNKNCNEITADTLRYEYEDGKIKNKKSNLCLKADKNEKDSIIKLVDCKDASQFDLV
jgi:hypothetical protein